MRSSRAAILWYASVSILAAALLCWAGWPAAEAAGRPDPVEKRDLPASAPARPGARAATSAPVYAVNPHWTPDGCRYCHKFKAGKPELIPLADVDAICLSCHDGVHARRERHPLGRLFIPGQVVKPEGWPTIDDRLICSTCHQHIVACRLEAREFRVDPDFLRGYEGGSLLAFCARCHIEPKYHRYKLHEMLTKDGKPIESKCLFCHTEEIKRQNMMVRTGNAELRTDPITLCESCHTEHLDYFEPGHPGSKVKPEMRGFMVAFEALGFVAGRYPTPEEIGQALRSGRQPERLPLWPGDKVVCSTCHNPHQKGVFPPGSVLAYGAMTPEEMTQRYHLRGVEKEICVACHDK
jgi:hypothetical protein